ncbi:CDT1-like protein b [Andrographis paniculata]|uniref:CDT1-like protein b n=1 Tax=Andrographis paniculata TaxID=175694 RepID=UPI0021E98FC1|nr:CDT1-like protein b [Andrographis paniculata]
MEEQPPELAAENTPDICSATSHSISPRKEGLGGADHPDDTFSSPTPVKTKEPSRPKNKHDLAQLPHEFMGLLEFFNRMTTSLRLLSLRRRATSFQNISTQVEILTGRKFHFMHLAQIKFVLPEAVQIDKILTNDETTKCMKSDMNITLKFEVVKDHHEESVFLALSNLFLTRLRHIYITQPQQDQLPEAELPGPFSPRSITFRGDSIPEDSSIFSEPETRNSSHLPPNFTKSFYQKTAAGSIKQTNIISPAKCSFTASSQTNVAKENPQLLSGISVDSTKTSDDNPPVELFVGCNSLSVETPVRFTPARPILPTKSVLSCEDENKTNLSQNWIQSSSSAKKSLDFYSMSGKGTIFSQKQKSFCLSELVLLINKIFQSVNFCPITKEELIQKVITNYLELDGQGEIEMQLEHLEDLVPDWFSKKLASSGDLLYKVKKVSDLNSICEKVNIM